MVLIFVVVVAEEKKEEKMKLEIQEKKREWDKTEIVKVEIDEILIL